MEKRYTRVILKVSGEALGGEGIVFQHAFIDRVVAKIKEVVELGVQVGIVVGGGNIWRGRVGVAEEMNEITADHMGMLATAINALALQDAFERIGQPTRVMTAVEMRQLAEPYIQRRALRHFEKGRVVIFACGTGNPGYSTDSGAALRAFETHADAVLKATNVDGVYDCDPRKNPNARMLHTISYDYVLEKNLGVMDATAIAQCRDKKIPIVVFNMDDPENIKRVILGEKIGTLVDGESELT